MARATRFYVPTIEFAKILDATQFTSDHPGVDCLDNNLDSYGKAISTQNNIKIDANPLSLSSHVFNWAGVWIHNHRSFNLPPNELIIYVRAADNPSFSGYSGLSTIYCDPDNTLPLAVGTFVPQTLRYLWLYCWNSGIIQETSLAMFGFYTDLNDVQWDWGHPDATYRYNNLVEELPSARTVVRVQSSAHTRRWHRRYEYLTTAQRNVIVLVFQLARGQFQPFIIQDGTETIKAAKFVRFTHDELIEDVQVANGLWHVEFEIEEVPYIPDEYNY